MPAAGDRATSARWGPRSGELATAWIERRICRVCSGPSEEIAFADLQPAMTQDVVGRGGVEIEVRQHEIDHELIALERHRVLRPDRESHVLLVGRIDVLRGEALDVVDRLLDARLELVDRLLVIGKFG